MKTELFAAMLLLSVPLAAQWLTYKTPGIPRTPDGKPDLSAAAPRTTGRQARSVGHLARIREGVQP
jgi:hypothetical protein